MAKTYSLGDTGIKGFDDVMRNLNEEIQKIEGRTIQGIIKAAIDIRRDMASTPPLIPIKTGNLRASWFIVTAKGVESKPPVFDNSEKGAAKVQEAYNASISEAQSTVAASSKENPFLVMGFGANYTMPVHEMIGDIEWSAKNTGPKFFESALKRRKDAVLKIIRDNAQIK
jgi:hypothetical protein